MLLCVNEKNLYMGSLPVKWLLFPEAKYHCLRAWAGERPGALPVSAIDQTPGEMGAPAGKGPFRSRFREQAGRRFTGFSRFSRFHIMGCGQGRRGAVSGRYHDLSGIFFP
jgi:hypothetical protein